MAFYIGLDVGGTTSKYGLFDSQGNILNTKVIPSHSDEKEDFIHRLAQGARDLLEENNLLYEDLQAMGIGVPGPVIHQTFVPTCVNLAWRNIDVGALLRKELPGKIIKLGNDANLAALGEKWKGAGKDVDSLVLITLGTGIGGGIVFGNHLISGYHGAAGEVGHISILDHDLDRLCNCGKRDCIELIASATGIIAQAKEKLKSSDRSSRLRKYQGELTAREIFLEAKLGDPIAMEVLEHTAYYLAKTIGIISVTLDPELFVIGGGVSNAGDQLLDPVRKYYKNFCFPTGKDTPIVQAELGNQAGMVGACKLVLGEI